MTITEKIGFCIRQTKLEPDTIVKVFTFGLWNIPNPSLQQIASKCEDIQYGLTITRSRIAQRLESSAKLLKEVFRRAFEYSARKATAVTTSGILSSFDGVKVCDSTKVTLPDKLANIWRGLGGNNAEAALKIQTVYSLNIKSVFRMEFAEAPGTDSSYRNAKKMQSFTYKVQTERAMKS